MICAAEMVCEAGSVGHAANEGTLCSPMNHIGTKAAFASMCSIPKRGLRRKLGDHQVSAPSDLRPG